MPYYRCAECDLTVFVGAGSSDGRACPDCGATLRAATPVFVNDTPRLALHRHLVREPRAVGAVRRELNTLLGRLNHAEVDVAGLLTTELIAGSIKHDPPTGGVLTLEVSVTDSSLRVTLTDGGNGFVPYETEKRRPGRTRGLQLLDELADRWGVDSGRTTAIWFELDRHARTLSTEPGAA